MMAFPLLRPDMIIPLGAPVNLKVAKSLVRTYLVQIGYCERAEASEFVRSFSAFVKDSESWVRDESRDNRASLRAELREAVAYLRELNLEWPTCHEPAAKQAIEDAIEHAERDINRVHRDLDAAVSAVASFRADFRGALVEFINTVVHGPNPRAWPLS